MKDWTWVRIDGHTERMLVPGGWIVRSCDESWNGRQTYSLMWVPWPAAWPLESLQKYLELDAQP